jgi:hypothetical protein
MSDDLDRVLSSEPAIEPSSRFMHSVMAAVEDAAVEPPPIPFPWWRALPGIVVTVVCLALAVINSPLEPQPAVSSSPMSVATEALFRRAATAEAMWISVGLLVSLASMTAAMRLDACRALYWGWRSRNPSDID